ncbi:urease accessory protein UreD [Actinoplanes sp. NBRC 14428]|nr:urease accessory protein UreD [Actinoplanes sp. NBRC 14428]
MRAEASLVAEADGAGGTRLAVLRGESPLLLRRTGPRGPGVTVHLVGGAAGPLRGDDLRLTIAVGERATLSVRSVAAQLALPGRPGAPPSRLVVTATVAAGGALLWAPEPLIAAAGCDHVAVTDVTVADGGTLVWRDDLVCGRHAEEPGDVRSGVTIRYAGRTLYRHELAVGPAAPGWSGPAVLGTARAIGSLIVAGPSPSPSLSPGSGSGSGASSGPDPADPGSGPGSARLGLLGGDAVVMPLAGPGVLASAVGPDIRQVRAALDPLTVLPVPVPV